MTKFSFRRSLAGLTAAALTFSAASAMAADVTPLENASFVVKSASDTNIRLAVKAFNKGEFDRSINFNQRALKGSLSSKRAAIAHSNLCAVYATVGEMDKAATACAAALELRSDYAPALENKAALTVQLAQNK